MKILFLSHLFPTKNDEFSGIVNEQRMQALLKNGNEILVIKVISLFPPSKYLFPLPNFKLIYTYLYNIWTLEKKIEQEGIQIFNLLWFPLPKFLLWAYQVDSLYLSIFKKFNRIVDNYKPDIVISSSIHPEGTYSRYIKKYYRIPVITIAEGSEILLYPLKYNGIKRIIKLLNKYSDAVVFVSHGMYEQISRKYTIPKSFVIKNGYDKEIFYYCPEERGKNKVFKILSVGSLDYNKGHDILINAIRNMEEFQLIIIGKGELFNTYKKMIDDYKLNDKVFLLGFINNKQIINFYRRADLFCLPSRSESFGVAAIEALSCGLPVIATSVCEMKDIIIDGFNGYLTDIDSIDSLRHAIIQARNANWDHRKISNDIKYKYGWDIWATNITKLINKQLNNYD